MSMKSFLIKKMMTRQLKKSGMSDAQQAQMLTIVEKNPDLFAAIAKETQEKVKGGMGEMQAMMQVAQKYKKELAALQQQMNGK